LGTDFSGNRHSNRFATLWRLLTQACALAVFDPGTWLFADLSLIGVNRCNPLESLLEEFCRQKRTESGERILLVGASVFAEPFTPHQRWMITYGKEHNSSVHRFGITLEAM